MRILFFIAGILVGLLGTLVYNRPTVSESLRSHTQAPSELSAVLVESAIQNLPEEKVSTSTAVKIPIFIFHSVRPIDPHDSKKLRAYEVSPELFEQELQYLSDNDYTPITLDQVADDLRKGSTFPVMKPVVLTFDDDWHNQYQYAFPLLKKYHLTGTFYLFTNAIGVNHYLSWEEIKEMQAAGMEFESHSVSHPFLKGLPPDKLQKELVASKKILEEHLGTPINHFASPFGDTSPAIMAAIQAAGYRTGRTTLKGVYQNDPYWLKGILVDDSFDHFVQDLQRK